MTKPALPAVVARFDQINASHRDALESVQRFSNGLFQMTEEDRQRVINELMPFQRLLLLELAGEANDARLLAALSGKDSE